MSISLADDISAGCHFFWMDEVTGLPSYRYRSNERNLIALRRTARSHGNYFAEPEAKVYFVVRIRGVNGVDPKTRKILQLLRLTAINTGVFLKVRRVSGVLLLFLCLDGTRASAGADLASTSRPTRLC